MGRAEQWIADLAGPADARGVLGRVDPAPGLPELRGGDEAAVGEGIAELDAVLLCAEHVVTHGAPDAVRAEHDVGVVRGGELQQSAEV